MRGGRFFLGLIAVIVLINSAVAYDIDFVANYTLGSSTIRDRPKCFQRQDDYHWYCTYLKTSDKKTYVEEFDDEFVSLNTDSFSCSDASGGLYTDCNYIGGTDDGNVIDCLCKEDDASPKSELQRFYYDNESLVQIDLETADIYFPAVVNDYLTATGSPKLWYKSAGTEPRYMTDDDINSGDGTGYFNFPSDYETYPDDFQAVYCGNSYILLMYNVTGSGTLVSLSFDTDRDYTGNSYNLISGLSLLEDSWGVSVDNAADGDVLLLAAANKTGYGSTDYPVIMFKGFSCNPGGSLSQVFEVTYNQTDFESDANATASKYIAKPYLTKDFQGNYNLFYYYISGASGSLKAAVQGTDCTSCSNWVATSDCYDGQQKYNRTCPTGTTCTNQTYWTPTSYCSNIYNQSQGIYEQQYTSYKEVSDCVGDWVDVGTGISECSPPSITIPADCSNITVREQAVPEYDMYFGGQGCEQGRFYVTACTPSWNCASGNYSCMQTNTSTERAYSDYSAGEVATGFSSMHVDTECKCSWGLFDYGIKKFRLHETLIVSCDIACEEEWYCLNDDYLGLRHIDCSVTNQTYCDYGCSGGECRGSATEDSSVPTSYDYWENFFLNPSPTQKFTQALLGCSILGIVGLVIGFNLNIRGSTIGLLFLVFFGVAWIGFILAGYIPAILTIIMVFFIGGYMLLKKL